ncbi:MAG: hypothetical protein QOJ74_1374, partial [Ilumatobacteraceae bacterium]|nr:hypothetical protein [Ilumatobacteraceae bacterium]
AAGRYRDARPTLAIPEADLVALSATTDWSLHPSLAPLTKYWDAGTAAFLPGIGFSEPNHSHCVSLDRWWRADDLSASTGWLGRSVDAGALPPLYATSLGSGAPLLRSETFQPAVVLQPSAFDFPNACRRMCCAASPSQSAPTHSTRSLRRRSRRPSQQCNPSLRC